MIRSTCLITSALAIGLVSSSAHAQSWPIGWTYATNITIDSGDAAHRRSIATRQRVIDHMLRTDFVQVSNYGSTGSAEGMYQLVNSADSTMTSVMPQQHMASIMRVGGLLAGRDIKPKIASHMTSSHLEDLGAAEKILGYPTHRYRLTSQGTLDVTIGGESCTGKIDGVAEMWIAPGVDLHAALVASASTLTSAMGMADDGAPDDTHTSILPPGTSLRTISKRTGVNAQGRRITVTTTSELVELAHGALDPSLFVVPSDYRTMDLSKMMADLPAGMLDSAISAGAAKGASGAKAVCDAMGSP